MDSNRQSPIDIPLIFILQSAIDNDPGARFAYIPAVRMFTAWLAVVATWALWVALFVGVSAFVLWIAGRVLPLSNRGRRRG